MRKFSSLGIAAQDIFLLAALAAALSASVVPVLGHWNQPTVAALQPQDGAPAVMADAAELVPPASFRAASDRASSLPSPAIRIPAALRGSGTQAQSPEACQGGLRGVAPFAARRSSASASDAAAMAIVLALVCGTEAPASSHASVAR